MPLDEGADALAEGLALLEEAGAEGIPVRLVGGLAVRYLCPRYPPRIVERQDLDLASTSAARPSLVDLLERRGFVPDRTFNALYGHKQLYFSAPSGRGVDVLIDVLEMCHLLEFKDRIDRMPITLDLCDLLLSKLQIVELNQKDARDVLYLLSAFPIDEGDEPGSIGLARFREIVGDDWGWWRTVTFNLDRVRTLIEGDGATIVPAGATKDVGEQLRRLTGAAEDGPKSLRWRLRARVGERVRWYQVPEESTHD